MRATLKDAEHDKSHHPARHDSEGGDDDIVEGAAVGFAENSLAKEESTCFCECETKYGRDSKPHRRLFENVILSAFA